MEDVELPDAQQILRRAVQLDRHVAPLHPLTPEALEAAAAELGVDPIAVAMALAESRAGVQPARRRLGERLIGPRAITVVRPCSVDADAAARLTAEWFERGHLLRVSTAGPGVLVARRRSDPAAKARRAVRSVQGEGGLSKVKELRSAVGQLADGTAAVCVQADVSDSRNGSVAVGSSIGTVAVAGVGVGVVVFSPLVILAAPLALASGVFVARQSHRDTVKRVRRSLEETTDAVAHGNSPASPLAGIGRTLRRIGRR